MRLDPDALVAAERATRERAEREAQKLIDEWQVSLDPRAPVMSLSIAEQQIVELGAAGRRGLRSGTGHRLQRRQDLLDLSLDVDSQTLMMEAARQSDEGDNDIDAFTPGNWDFGYGPRVYRQRFTPAMPPLAPNNRTTIAWMDSMLGNSRVPSTWLCEDRICSRSVDPARGSPTMNMGSGAG